jgi:cell division protein FtsI (penicillin-binding protein 3)
MMRPRLVKKIVKDGVVLEEVQPEVMREHIANPQTIKTMQTILTHVVSQGLGRKAGSPSFAVAGKTGTAQVADQYGGYHSGITRYWLSFCGYFPADNPRYTCIVCIKKTGLPASGGGMSGVAFHHIAEGVMAHSLKLRVEDARDTTSILIPDVKNGNILAADYVLGQLGVRTKESWNDDNLAQSPIWGKATREKTDVTLKAQRMGDEVMPDVMGMGASDAVFLLEDLGLKVKLSGKGRVRYQSIAAGREIAKGMTCQLHLE